ncbi:hypothetical protein [Pseudonocardia yunnanensis]|uniref:Type II toxin-antitoxin system RelE/ParE family toxin n=1 Tax=Pseudonocardia yunnanensis TaxID=58107 RepID=A0ABW4ELA3_9PSEU
MRDVRESALFTEQCQQLGLEVKRLDEVLESVVWAVANAAEDLQTVPGSPLGWIATDPWPGVPEMIVLFRIESDEIVDLKWIEVLRQDPNDPTDG